MSQTVTLALRDEIYRSLLDEGKDGGIAPEAVAVHILEERFSSSFAASKTDPAVTAARLEKFRNWRPPWHDRDDIGDSVAFVRAVRQGTRSDRLAE